MGLIKKVFWVQIFTFLFCANLTAAPHTVMVMLEARADKVEEMKAALMKIAEESRKEDSNIDYHVYQDPHNPVRFALHENWVSKDLHALQFEKPYIIEFGEKAKELLASPYLYFFGNEISSDSD